jgi:RNA polymerase sigma factor (sigma-70 family)
MPVSLPPFQVLLDAHGADVHRFLISRVGRQEADDCLQETLLSALRAYPALRDARNLKGWLFTIAHRKALDVHRRRRHAPLDGVPEPGAEDAPPSDDALWRRVGALPPRQRVAVALRYACDLSYAEIARVDGGSEEAARRNVHAGLTRLRQEVAP